MKSYDARMTQPSFETISVLIDGAVGEMRLARPDRLNALSSKMLLEIIDASNWWATQSDVRTVVVSGEGRSFSAGFDLSNLRETGSDMSPRDSADLGRRMADALTNIPQVTIAAVHGHCVGGGVILASACDLRIAHPGTTFIIPEVDLGMPLTWGGIPRLVRELGPAVTKELVLTCRPFDAAEAKSLRFVNSVESEPRSAALNLARQIAAKPLYALQTTKQQVNAVTEEMISTARSVGDADQLLVAMRDPESRETSAHYLSRRKRD